MAQLVCRVNRDEIFHEHTIHSADKPGQVHLTAWVNTPVKLNKLETAIAELMEEVEEGYHEASASVFHFPALSLQGSASRKHPVIVRLRPGMSKNLAKSCVQKLRAHVREKYRQREAQEA